MSELSSLKLHFENLWCLLIFVRSGPVLMSARVRTFGETDEKLATGLDIANVTLHFQKELVRLSYIGK